VWKAQGPFVNDTVFSYGSMAKDGKGKSKETFYLVELKNE
jgi:hypothetical protein